MPKYNLKSGKQSFQVQHTSEQQFQDFQAKVYDLTDIPPKNLKILFKGKMIKDNQSLLQISQGSCLIVMGTKTGKQLKQTGQIKIDDIKIDQQKKIQKFGLVNIGNTCYMNASIQFLKSVPVVNKLIRNIKISNNNTKEQVIGHTLGNVLKQMEKKDVSPKIFVGLFLNAHPEFQPFGTQHDADQFMQKLIQDLSASNPQNAQILKKQFEVQLINTLTNLQIEQQPYQSLSCTTKIGCSLGGNDKQLKVGTLTEGIRLGLQTKLQKKSQKDHINHKYQCKSKFNLLPKFLIIQMVRFYWKQVNQPDSQFNKPQATKICRAVDFSIKLDLFDFCTEQLKKTLTAGRLAYEQNKKKDEQQFKKQYQQYKKTHQDANRPQKKIMQDFKQLWKKKQQTLNQGLQTGMYEMSAVLTHLGSSVQSGHYMTWVKQKQQWIKYNDDNVYPQPQDKVFQLRGGQPNLEIAYLFMMRKIYTKPL